MSTTGVLFNLPKQSVFSSGSLLPGAQVFFYANGTTTKQAIYVGSDLQTQHENPVVADAYGKLPAIFLHPSFESYKVVIAPSDDTDPPASAIETVDDYPIGFPSTLIKYDITPAEISAGATPVNFSIAPYNVLRYGNNTVPGTTDMTAAIQAAINSNVRIYIPNGLYITNELTVPSDRVIEFESELAILKLATSADVGDNILTNEDHVNGNSNISIIGGKTDGNRAARAGISTAGPGDCNVLMIKVSDFKIRDHFATSARRHGINTHANGGTSNSDDQDFLEGERCQRVRIVRCKATDCGDDGITLHYTDDAVIANNICWNMAATQVTNSNGIEVESANRNIIIPNNLCYNDEEYVDTTASARDGDHSLSAGSYMRRGIEISGSENHPASQNVTAIGNVCCRLYQGIVVLHGGTTGSDTGKNVNILGNTITQTQESAIWVQDYVGYKIADNIVEDEQSNHVGMDAAIRATEGASQGIITGNKVRNYPSAEYGISVSPDAGVGHLVSDNYVENSGTETPIRLAPGKGILFGVNYPNTETATGTFSATDTAVTDIDSSAGAVTLTIPNGLMVGQRKTITMSDASNSSTVSVSSHETSSPEIGTFEQTTDVLVLEWTGTVWWTVKNIGVAF